MPTDDAHNVRRFPRGGERARQVACPNGGAAGLAIMGAPELEALRIQERGQTLRLGLCIGAAVLLMACLIPIANAGPRFPFRRSG